MNARRWFKFSLRTMLVLVLLLSVALGWLGVQLKWIRDRSEARAWAESKLIECYKINVVSSTAHAPYFQSSSPHNYRAAPWPLRIFSEPGVFSIEVPTSAADYDLQIRRMQRLFPEAQVSSRLELDLPELQSTVLSVNNVAFGKDVVAPCCPTARSGRFTRPDGRQQGPSAR